MLLCLSVILNANSKRQACQCSSNNIFRFKRSSTLLRTGLGRKYSLQCERIVGGAINAVDLIVIAIIAPAFD